MIYQILYNIKIFSTLIQLYVLWLIHILFDHILLGIAKWDHMYFRVSFMQYNNTVRSYSGNVLILIGSCIDNKHPIFYVIRNNMGLLDHAWKINLAHICRKTNKASHSLTRCMGSLLGYWQACLYSI